MRNGQEAREPSTRSLLRSLLQKAVRRGDAQLAKNVACRLAEDGDSAWLKTRTGVIAFEECWPYGARLLNHRHLLSLGEMARLVKNKEAAGLGTLAYALAGGDYSVFDVAPNPIAVKIVAASLSRTDEFFSWAGSNCSNGEKTELLRNAHAYFQRASWPWDKAFATAAAYLAINSSSLVIERAQSTKTGLTQFPLWVAVDKHTSLGKAALRKSALQLKIPPIQLEWASFYFESALCNEGGIGPWWEAEMNWRFTSVSLTASSAQSLWEEARDHVRNEAASGVELLEAALRSINI